MPTIDHESLQDLTFRIFRAAGAPEGEARIVSEHLVNSNLAGHDSHGVWHVPGYARAAAWAFSHRRFVRARRALPRR